MRLEAPVVGELLEGGVPDDPPLAGRVADGPRPIVEMLAGVAPEVLEGPLVGVQKLTERLAHAGLVEAAAGVALVATTPSARSRRRILAERGVYRMKNVEMTVEGNVLTIKVDLSKEFGPSASGKTIIVASTEGNIAVPDRDEKIGLNVYRKK